jgi:uncharacterized protein Yka (UPF0111/DUF47 family)
MKSLKEQIDEMEYEIRQRKEAIKVYEKAKQKLLDARAHCDHEFQKPIVGYEHEGGYCVKCGINELYAMTLKMST